jgi:hypothetical protein
VGATVDVGVDTLSVGCDVFVTETVVLIGGKIGGGGLVEEILQLTRLIQSRKVLSNNRIELILEKSRFSL